MLLFYSNIYNPRDFKTYKFQNEMNIARTIIIYWDALAHQLQWSLFERRGNNYAEKTKYEVYGQHRGPWPVEKGLGGLNEVQIPLEPEDQ